MSPEVHEGVLYGADEIVAATVAKNLGLPPFAAYKALGVMRGDRVTGGVVFHNWRGHDIEITAWIKGAAWAKASVLRRLFQFPFVTCGCTRMTAVTAAQNAPVRRILERFGFSLEGFHPRGGFKAEDAVSYGMLVEDCRWIENTGGSHR